MSSYDLKRPGVNVITFTNNMLRVVPPVVPTVPIHGLQTTLRVFSLDSAERLVQQANRRVDADKAAGNREALSAIGSAMSEGRMHVIDLVPWSNRADR